MTECSKRFVQRTNHDDETLAVKYAVASNKGDANTVTSVTLNTSWNPILPPDLPRQENLSAIHEEFSSMTQMANTTPEQVQLFVRAAEEVMQMEEGTMKSTVLESMGGRLGVIIMKNLFGLPKTFVIKKVVDAKAQVSLTQSFIPFLSFAMDSSVLNSAMQHLVNTFLQSLGNAFDWDSLCNTLHATLRASSASDSVQQPATMCDSVDLLSIFQPILTFGLELLRRFNMAFLQELEMIQPILEMMCQNIENGILSPRLRREIKRKYIEFISSISQKSQKQEVKCRLAEIIEQKSKERASIKNTIDRKKFSINQYSDPPGEYRAGGMRHDNDDANIQNISIAPTEGEVLCRTAPYLPPNKAGTVVHLPIGSAEAHRDLHFRLLRHNLIADIQESIGAFVELGGVPGLHEQDAERARKAYLKNNVSMDLYRGVVVLGISTVRNIGVSYEIQFEQIEHVAKRKGAKQRLAFWSRSNRLAHGSLLCLLWHENGREQPNVVFGAVSERDGAKLAAPTPTLSIRTLPNTYCPKLISMILNKKTRHVDRTEIVMIQAGPSFFAFEPVLNALKTAHIPLAHLICEPPVGAENQTKDVDLPVYAAKGGVFDLNPLSTYGSRRYIECLKINSESPDLFPLQELGRYSTLDKDQAEAVKAALSQELVVIQGPPGTGKTYVGVQIVRALLSFKPRGPERELGTLFPNRRNPLPPILCVCYTNHALDQFLEDLINAGVTNVIRVGGMGKNPALDDINLRNMNKPTLGVRGYKIRKELLPQLEEEITRSGLRSNHGKFPKWQDVNEYICATCPRFVTFLKTKISPCLPVFDNEHYWVTEFLDKEWNAWCEGMLLRPPLIPMKRDIDKLLQLEDFNEITEKEQYMLCDYWRNLYQDYEDSRPFEIVKEYKRLTDEYVELQTASDLSCLNRASVVGMTTTYAAKHQNLLAGLMPKVVILEEAAEVLEAHVLTCLSNCTEQLIMIGDHLQLRPKVDSYLLQAESDSGFDLDLSLFERLITQNDIRHVTLSSQRRMRPQFSKYQHPPPLFDLREFDDHSSVHDFPKNVPGMKKTLFFFNHDHKESGQEDGKSKSNVFEANFAVQLALHLMKQECFKAGDVAIITTYVGQLHEIRKHLSAVSVSMNIDERDKELLTDFMDNLNEKNTESDEHHDKTEEKSPRSEIRADGKLDKCVRLATVDNFQGEEARVIILSTVRNNKEGHIGFVGIENRINVMLSRAKEGMYILGNAQSLEACKKTDMWKKVLKEIREQNAIGDHLELQCQIHPRHITKIAHWNELTYYINGGGCRHPCGGQFPCGHICKRMCHLEDRDHLFTKCHIPVAVEFDCGHVKTNVPCLESKKVVCDEDVEVVVKACRYNHFHKVECRKATSFVANPKNCKVSISVKIPACGHRLQTVCYKEKSILEDPACCNATCGHILETCGHACQRNCGGCYKRKIEKQPGFKLTNSNRHLLEHGECQSRCGKRLSCGHDCAMKCHEGKGDCDPCKERCSIVCVHRKSGCSKKCSEPCVPCAMDCVWECDHRGRCLLPCGAPCDRLPCDRRCDKKLSCGCRCPSLCGEPCPPSEYCLQHGTDDVKNMDVDIIMFRTYKDLTDAELNEDPLIVLNCGHAFLMSTLDGHFEIDKFYEKSRYGVWIKTTNMSFRDFTSRKCCMVCRKPITGVRRYGRMINKASVDFMERVYFQKFETKLSDLFQETKKLSDDVAVLLQTRSVEFDRLTFSRLRKKVLEEEEKALKLIAECSKTPAYVLGKKTRETLLGLEKTGAIESDDRDRAMQSWLVHQPDLTRPCKCYTAYGESVKLSIKLQTRALNTFDQRTCIDTALSKTARALAAEVETGKAKMDEAFKKAATALDTAVESGSNTRIVETCEWVIQVYVESIRYTLALRTTAIASALSLTYFENKTQIKALQDKMLQNAEDFLLEGKNACTSPQQVERIAELDKKIQQMSKACAETSLEDQMNILKTIITHDPTISSLSGRGHVYRCPNGHFYVIGDCGGARDRANCPECGAVIGGEAYVLASSNTRIDGQALALFNLQ